MARVPRVKKPKKISVPRVKKAKVGLPAVRLPKVKTKGV